MYENTHTHSRKTVHVKLSKKSLGKKRSHVTVSHCVFPGSPPQIQMWRDCADVYKSGHSVSGLYYIYISNSSEPVQVQPTPELRPVPHPD